MSTAVLDDQRLDETFAALQNAQARDTLALQPPAPRTSPKPPGPSPTPFRRTPRNPRVPKQRPLWSGPTGPITPRFPLTPSPPRNPRLTRAKPANLESPIHPDDRHPRKTPHTKENPGIAATPNTLVPHPPFNPPAATVWKMWTDPDHFARWYGPRGASIRSRSSTSPSAVAALSPWRCTHPMAPGGCTSRGKPFYSSLSGLFNRGDGTRARSQNPLTPTAARTPRKHKVRVDLKSRRDEGDNTEARPHTPPDSPGDMG